MFRSLSQRLQDQTGQSSIEYVGIVALVGIVIGVLIAAAPGWAQSLVHTIGSQIDKIVG